MALNIDVGKIKFTWRGAYDAATTYERDDVVSHGGDSWVCVIGPDTFGNAQTVTGTEPTTTATAQWNKMAQGASLGNIPGIAAGDIFYYDGSDFQRLAIGTDDQVLKASSGSPVWGDASPARCHLIQRQTQNRTGAWQTGTSYTTLPGFSMDFTPLRSDTIIIFKAQFLASWLHNGHAIQHFRLVHNGSDVDYWTCGATYYEDIVHYEYQFDSWGTSQRNTYIRTREYSSNGHMLRFFETQYWDGGGGDQDNTNNRCTMEEWLIT